jgi:hypothetical protein
MRFLILATLAATVTVASAAPISVFSTGNASAGGSNGSTVDGTPDAHWTFTNSSSVTGAALVAANSCVDFYANCTGSGGWVPNTTSSAWIVDNLGSPQTGGLPLRFQQTFSLAGLDPTTAVINLQWAIDDGGELWLNGVPMFGLTGSSGDWTSLHPVTLNSGFLPGVNTLSIVLTSSDNAWEGVRVQIDSATANAVGGVPEPSTMVFVGGGLLTLGWIRRKRNLF